MNEKYSYRDFTNKDLSDTDPKEWNDSEVIGSCFYQFTPKTNPFPQIDGVKFIKCNLDNCVVPKGCTVEGGCNRLIAVQNDGEDWILDANLSPVEPVNKARFEKLGLSTDPADLPVVKASLSVTQVKLGQISEKLQTDINALIEGSKTVSSEVK